MTTEASPGATLTDHPRARCARRTVLAQDNKGCFSIIRNRSRSGVIAPSDRVAGQHIVNPLFGPTKTNSLNGSKVVFLTKSRTT